MNRYELISKMVDIAEKHNDSAMRSAGMDDAAIMNMALQVRPQLFIIQGEILDILVSEGLVSIDS